MTLPLEPWLIAVIFLIPAAVLVVLRLKQQYPGTPNVEKLQPASIKFVGEQDGPREKTLKSALTSFFEGDPAIQKAYLARIGIGEQHSVALCLKADPLPDESYPEKIAEIFLRVMGPGGNMDVLFLADQQEIDLARVCRPFYEPKRLSGKTGY